MKIAKSFVRYQAAARHFSFGQSSEKRVFLICFYLCVSVTTLPMDVVVAYVELSVRNIMYCMTDLIRAFGNEIRNERRSLSMLA